MRTIWRHTTDRSLTILSLLISVALLITAAPHSYAADVLLQNRYDRLSDSNPSAVSRHTIGLTMTDTAVPVGSILIEFCSNSPIIGDACTAPVGMDASGVTLLGQTGDAGFSISPLSTASSIILTRPAALPLGTASQYEFGNIINPSGSGSHFGRLQTFTSTDATGLAIEQGGVVFAIGQGLSLTTEVPPYLVFCASVTIANFDCGTATSFFIDLGDFKTTSATTATSEFQVATNAPNGYSITMSGTTLTSGNNTIPALYPASASQNGVSQFGVNLAANSSPSVGTGPAGYPAGNTNPVYAAPNNFAFQNGDVVASSTTTSDYKKFTVSYLVNVASNQPAGVYATTITYICLANF